MSFLTVSGRSACLRALINASLSVLLFAACRDSAGTRSSDIDVSIRSLEDLSGFQDTAAVSRRLALIVDSLGQKKQPLPLRLSLFKARADLLRRKGMPDSGFALLLKGVEQSLESGDSLALAGVLLDMCRWKEREGRFIVARSFSERALSLYRRYGTEQDVASALDATARQCQDIGAYPTSQAMMLEALMVYEKNGDDEKSAQAYTVVGNNYADLGEPDKAMDYYRRSADVQIKLKDSGRLATAYANIGLMHRRSNPDSALYYYAHVRRLTGEGRNVLQYVICLFNEANIHFDRKDYTRAGRIYDTVMALCQRHHFVDGIPRVFSGYAAIAGAANDHRTSGAYLATARQMADSMGQATLALWLRKEELSVAEKRKDIDSVIALSKDIRRREDSIIGAQQKAKVAELELQYLMAGKEREIGDLHIRLTARLRMIGLMVALILSLCAVILLYQRQRRILLQRNRTYETMIARYQATRDMLPGRISVESGRVGVGEPFPEDDLLGNGTDDDSDGEAGDTDSSEVLLDIHARVIQLLLEEGLYRNADLTPAQLSARLGLSVKKLTSVIHAVEGRSVLQFLNRFRIAEATRMLESSDAMVYKLETVATRCGFNNRQHFHRVFEQVTGVTPGFYRKRFQSESKKSD